MLHDNWVQVDDGTLSVNEDGLSKARRLADSDATLVDGAFEYVTPGQVDDVSPASGNRGTEVTITGTGLLSGGSNVVAVTLDDIDANIQSQSDDTVVVIAAASASASTGHVVLTADTGAVITHEGAWEYLVRGSVSAVNPSTGQIGTRITLVGTGMLSGGSEASSVTLGGAAATVVSSSNTAVVLVATAEQSLGAGTVTITSNTGSIVELANGFTYVAAGAIDSVTPSSGQIGTSVTIRGTSLLAAGGPITGVTLAGVTANIQSQSDTVVVVTAASSGAQTGDVVITVTTRGLPTSRNRISTRSASAYK